MSPSIDGEVAESGLGWGYPEKPRQTQIRYRDTWIWW
jgi:hypothetical protein